MGFPGMTFPADVIASNSDTGIDAKHEEFIERQTPYFEIDLLTDGGYKLHANAAHVLDKKPKEVSEVYVTRQMQFRPQNLMGTAIAYYIAAMFREEWSATLKKNGATYQPPEDAVDFWRGDKEGNGGWFKNVDRRGTDFSSFLAKTFEAFLKFQRGWVLTDMPSSKPNVFRSYGDQKAAGVLDPYIVLYDGRNVINWDEDDQGNLNWVVIWVPKMERQPKQKPQLVDYWLYYDRKNYEIYRALRRDNAQKPDATKSEMIDDGPHALAEFKRVPIRRFEVPEIFWLGNRGLGLAKAHANLSATYNWSLFMANLPVPYISGDYKEPPVASETELMVLPEGTKFGWTEPEGKSFEHSAREIASKREEFYRMMYLQAQGKDASATASAMSGVSKEADFRPVAEVLAKYAGWLKTPAENVLRDVADARGDTDIRFVVVGTEFEEDDSDAELATLELANDADIPSDTLEKELQKRAARKLLRGADDAVIAAAEKEIDEAPTKTERAAQQTQQASEMFGQALSKGLNRSIASGVVADVKEA